MRATGSPHLEQLRPLLNFCAELDLHDPAAAQRQLEEAFPADGEDVRSLERALRSGVEDGTVCHRGEPPVQYSRLFGATAESLEFSADAVLMSAPGPRHLHPEGEINLCFEVSGDPTFDGRPPGWTVYPPGSQHVPTVEGGTMLILYLLPSGAIEFLK